MKPAFLVAEADFDPKLAVEDLMGMVFITM